MNLEVTIQIEEKYYCSLFSAFNHPNYTFNDLHLVVDDIVNNIDNLSRYFNSLPLSYAYSFENLFDKNLVIDEKHKELFNKTSPVILKTYSAITPSSKEIQKLEDIIDISEQTIASIFNQLVPFKMEKCLNGIELFYMIKNHENFKISFDKLNSIINKENEEVLKSQKQQRFIVRQNQYKQYQLLKQKFDNGEFDDLK